MRPPGRGACAPAGACARAERAVVPRWMGSLRLRLLRRGRRGPAGEVPDRVLGLRHQACVLVDAAAALALLLEGRPVERLLERGDRARIAERAQPGHRLAAPLAGRLLLHVPQEGGDAV